MSVFRSGSILKVEVDQNGGRGCRSGLALISLSGASGRRYGLRVVFVGFSRTGSLLVWV